MSLIERSVKFKTFTPEEVKEMYENPPANMHVMRGGVIFEGEVWLTEEQAKDPNALKEAERKIQTMINKTVRQGLR